MTGIYAIMRDDTLHTVILFISENKFVTSVLDTLMDGCEELRRAVTVVSPDVT